MSGRSFAFPRRPTWANWPTAPPAWATYRRCGRACNGTATCCCAASPTARRCWPPTASCWNGWRPTAGWPRTASRSPGASILSAAAPLPSTPSSPPSPDSTGAAVPAVLRALLRRAGDDLPQDPHPRKEHRRAHRVHFDNVYIGRGSPRVLSCWMPWGDVAVDQGPLAICAGLARSGQLRAPARHLRAPRPGPRLHQGRRQRRRPLLVPPARGHRAFGGRWLTSNSAPATC